MPVNGQPLEPLLAGTLVLISAYQKDDPCPHMVSKIISNLERLAADCRLSDPFRVVIRRLSLQWLDRDPEHKSTTTPRETAPCTSSLH